MSRHHKCLTLEALNDTWDEIGKQSRLHEQRINQVRADAMKAATNEAKREIDKARAEVNERLKKEVMDLEHQTDSRLADLDRRHNESLRQVANQIYDDMGQKFEEMSQTLESKVEVLDGRIDNVEQWTQQNLDIIERTIQQMQQDTNNRFEQQQQQIDSIQLSIQSIQEHFNNEATMARDVAIEMTQLLKSVCNNHPVDIYAPEELREIRTRINDLSTRNWPPATFISISDDIMHNILKMKEKTILEKAKHDHLLRQTKARLIAILAVISENINMPAEHEGTKVAIVTDHWTGNEYSEVLNKLKTIEGQLADKKNTDKLSFNEIADLLKDIEKLNIEGIALMQKALNRAIQSYDRAAVTALDIVNSYIQQGYVLKEEHGEDDFGYIENDQRNGVFVILRHPIIGNEVSILIQPNPDDKTNRVDYQIDNPKQPLTAQQLHALLEQFRQKMNSIGYKVGPVEIPSDGGDEVVSQMHSGQQLRQAGAAERLRDVL